MSGRGTQLPSGELVNILLFADDKIIISNSEVDLLALKRKISAAKSSIISPDSGISCRISDLTSRETDCLGMVNHYKFLGMVQHLSPLKTAKKKGVFMVVKECRYKDIILRTSFPLVD